MKDAYYSSLWNLRASPAMWVHTVLVCYLPLGESTPLSLVLDLPFSPGGMEGWVDMNGWLLYIRNRGSLQTVHRQSANHLTTFWLFCQIFCLFARKQELLMQCYLGSCECHCQIASHTVRRLLQGTRVWQTERRTDDATTTSVAIAGTVDVFSNSVISI